MKEGDKVKTRTLVIIASSLAVVFVLLIGVYILYCVQATKKETPVASSHYSTTETPVLRSSSEASVLPPTTVSIPETSSTEDLVSQIEENNSKLASQQAESESLQSEMESIEASLSEESARVSASISESIEESIKSSISESQRESMEESRRQETSQTQAPSEKPPTETKKPTETKPKGNPKLTKNSITIKAGDVDSFIQQAQSIEVQNSTVGAMLDYNGVSFYTPGTYTAYFVAMDNSYSLPLTVYVE